MSDERERNAETNERCFRAPEGMSRGEAEREHKRLETKANILEIAETWAECSDNEAVTGRFDTVQLRLATQAFINADTYAERQDFDAASDWCAIAKSLKLEGIEPQ